MMFFIRAGSILAWAVMVWGAIKLALGIYVATQFEGKEEMIAASRRYLATANSGEAIDGGLKLLAAGILIGLLVQIAKNRNP